MRVQLNYFTKMMLKSVTLLTLVALCLSLPLEDTDIPNPVQHEVQPLSPSDNQLLNQLQDSQLPLGIPQLDGSLSEQQSPENKPDEDLKTESSHWRGNGYHGHGYNDHGGRDYGHGYGHGHGHNYGGYGGHGYNGYGGHGYGGYGGNGGGYGNGIGFGFGYPSNRRSFQQSYYPDYYYRQRVNPYYYPQNYYIGGGSIYW